MAMLAAEAALLRAPLAAQQLQRIARIDLGYGLLAGLALAAGLLRVFYGAKGSGFYADNPVFWAKLGVFLLITLLSIPPTVRLAQWRRAYERERRLPDDASVGALRKWLIAELVLFMCLPLLAAAMARGIGY